MNKEYKYIQIIDKSRDNRTVCIIRHIVPGYLEMIECFMLLCFASPDYRMHIGTEGCDVCGYHSLSEVEYRKSELNLCSKCA